MGSLMRPLVIVLFLSCASARKSYDPMVAFVCNMGAMHMDPDNGWYSDVRTDCLESKENILDYCKTVYPSLDITNIVEDNEQVSIKGWCPLGKKDCSSPKTFQVQPYRCLTGPFQSDALVVPHGCLFDHVHQPKECRGHDWWAEVASKSCDQLHKMKTREYAVLLPCGTDLFTGVEFVCCPDGNTDADSDENEADDNDIKPKIEVKVSSPSDGDASYNTEDYLIQKYMHINPIEDGDNEHEVYELAKKQLLKVNHDKITKLMKEWSDARNRVVEMKGTDPKHAEKMNADISERFQKEYFSLQVEGDSKALQLDAVHQQHVQTNFNYKKRTIMQQLMSELQADYYSVEKIMSLLQRYISVEEKDGRHCVKHFLKIRSRDPAAAQDLLPTTLEHLTLISSRINQSIDLVDSIDDESVVNKIKTSIRSWVRKTYLNLDNTIKQFKAMASSEKVKATPPVTTPATATLPIETSVRIDIEDSDKKNMYKVYADKLSKTDFVMKAQDTASLQEENEKENEHKSRVDSLRLSELRADIQNGPEAEAATPGMTAGVAVAIACSVIGALMVVTIAVLMVKRSHRGSGHYSNIYLEVSPDSPDASPEDRHIAAMQNGYENPTYKLLEQRKI